MPSIPIVPVALAASLGGLYYVDMKYKALVKTTTVTDTAAHDKSVSTKKKIRCGLMGISVALCLAIVYNFVNNKRAASSFENRVANASNALRSSMGSHVTSSANMSPSDSFSARVSTAAAELRKQLAQSEASSSGLFTPPPVEDLTADSSAELAAKASAEISAFIAQNS